MSTSSAMLPARLGLLNSWETLFDDECQATFVVNFNPSAFTTLSTGGGLAR